MIDKKYNNKAIYNIKRYYNCLKSQKKDNNKYRPEFSHMVKKQLKSIKRLVKNSNEDPKYIIRVEHLIGCAVRFPMADENRKINSFSFIGFDRPEATHRRSDYDNKTKGYEVWTKDIDHENRLIYGIYNKSKIIEFLSIKGHDLIEDKIYSDSETMSKDNEPDLIDRAFKGEWITSEEIKEFIKKNPDYFKNL